MSNAHPASRARGITLVELVSTLAISGVLVGTAVPGFQGLTAKSRMSAEVNTLLSHLYLARSEAVKRVTPAVLCPSINGSSCISQPDWHRGYILFSDRNNNGQRDNGEELLGAYQGGARQVTAISSIYRKRVTYRPDGMAGGSNVTVTFCHQDDVTPPKAVIVSNTGRPRISSTKPDGTALTCL